jgi:hypothetical protein
MRYNDALFILGFLPNTKPTYSEIKAAYRKHCKITHPDKIKNSDTSKFNEIKRAYHRLIGSEEVSASEESSFEHDNKRTHTEPPKKGVKKTMFSSISDIFYLFNKITTFTESKLTIKGKLMQSPKNYFIGGTEQASFKRKVNGNEIDMIVELPTTMKRVTYVGLGNIDETEHSDLVVDFVDGNNIEELIEEDGTRRYFIRHQISLVDALREHMITLNIGKKNDDSRQNQLFIYYKPTEELGEQMYIYQAANNSILHVIISILTPKLSGVQQALMMGAFAATSK